ncbi:hypothetical protein GN241_11180 [Rhodobacteraceae bacterium IMCC1335]
MSDKTFKFDIGHRTALAESGGTEEGRIIGCAQYEHSEDNYYLRYRAADGRCVEAWWPESALAAAN